MIQYVRLFSQRTSIRGIPKIENSKMATLRWFWGGFILIAHVFMITLVVLLIMRFFRYDRTIKMDTPMADPIDFPEVTVCSKRFFAMESEEFLNPLDILNDYSKTLLSQITRSLETDTLSVIKMLKMKYTTSSFFHTNYKFIQQWTYNLSTQMMHNCAINVLDGQLDNKNRFLECHIKPVFHPEYLNCLAFSIPRQNNRLNRSTSFQMEIFIPFTKPSNVMIDNFKMDEYISDIYSDAGYQETKVYMHKVDDYPFEFDFEAPIDCRGLNIYIVEKTIENQYFTGGSESSCNLKEFNTTVYGTPYKATRGSLCESLFIQNIVKDQCKCFMDTVPNNDPNYPTVKLCDYNLSFYICLRSVMNWVLTNAKSSCLPYCTKTGYIVLHKVKAIYSSLFSKKIDSLFYKTDNCRDDLDYCIQSVNCIIKELFKNYTNVTCTDSVSGRIKTPVSERTAFISQILETIKIDPTLSLNSSKKCKVIDIKVKMRKKMKVLTESLIVEMNTLLSQMGGICSFFTGLTFTLIAEIMETFIFWIHDKCSSKVQPQ